MLGLNGRTVSHYHFLEQIGQGGMSSVFSGIDLRDQRAVAIKVLSPYIAHEARFKARFEREIKLLRRLQHPNIMPILDFGEVDGLAFIVMPYIGTGTLADRLTKSPLAPQEGARIIGQLASALEAAHAAGVVHRDVKPSNVLLDPAGNALLSDFSFAHQTDASQNLTGSALIGTPAYMSPEQCRGEPIDARSDQYAFAVMLYQITTGRLPFEADTPMAIALKHVNEPLPRPRLVNPNLPDDIELVLVKGLAKDPANRYPSLTALNLAFQEALTNATDPARRAARTRDIDRTTAIYNKYQNVRPPARRRWYERTVVLAALVALLVFPALAAAGAALFFPEVLNGGASAAGAPPDVYATVEVILTSRAPGGTELPPGAVETAVAMLQTAEALGADLEQGQVEAIVLAGADLPTATPTPSKPAPGLPPPPATPTRTLAPGESPPPPTVTPSPTRTFTPEPSPTVSQTGAGTATPTGGGGGPTPVSTGVGPTPTTGPPTATPTNTPAPTNTSAPPDPTIRPNQCKYDDPGHPHYCTPVP